MRQIGDWLEKLGLGQYAPRFAENDNLVNTSAGALRMPMPLPIYKSNGSRQRHTTAQSLSCRRCGYPRVDGKCVDSEESLGN